MKNNNLTGWGRIGKSLDTFGNSMGNVFDDFMRPFGFDGDAMKTDIKETDDEYLLDIEMPGYDKKDISVTVEDGYVIVSASKTENKDEENKHSYVRRERSVSCSRSYYVGDVKEEEIKAKYENGILLLKVPKLVDKPDKKRSINID